MNLQEQILDDMAQRMAKSIDRSFIISMCVMDGWSEIVIDPWKHNNNQLITRWCRRYFKDQWLQEGNRWIIKDPKDATIFALRWA